MRTIDSSSDHQLRIEGSKQVGAAWFSMVGGTIVAAANLDGSIVLLVGGGALAVFSVASLVWRWRHPFLEANSNTIIICDRPVPPARTIALGTIESWKYRTYLDEIEFTRSTGRKTSFKVQAISRDERERLVAWLGDRLPGEVVN